MEGGRGNDSQSNKDEVMCHAMLWNEPGKAESSREELIFLICFLKDKYKFSFRESGEEENSGEKNNKTLI